jgi:hypothetical protein
MSSSNNKQQEESKNQQVPNMAADAVLVKSTETIDAPIV